MPELTAVTIALFALLLVAGTVLGWVLRGDRSAKEKIAINAGWQQQIESQQSEHDRLAKQNKSLMEQISQYQASMKDSTLRAKELSDSLKETFQRRDELQSIDKFFYPLDMVREWNRLYGPRGFLQWQCLVPFGEEEVLREIVETLAEHQIPSPVSVLKYFGEADPGPLSFPAPGWTLTLDVPTGIGGLLPLLDGLDRRVVDAGGRLYLAKESRMRPELVPAMYPRLDEWREVRDRMDPDRRMVSDLARRLDLLG